jgi:hypothetical protein
MRFGGLAPPTPPPASAAWAGPRCWFAPTAAKPARVPDRDLLLTYRDETNEDTVRRVRIHRVRRVPDGLVVEAHCRLRDAPRRFRVDRVTALADLGTGRVCPDPLAFLVGLEGI